VRRTAAAVLSGIQVGSLFEQQKVFDVIVWGEPDIRRNLSNVQNMKLNTADGQQVRLGDVADVSVTSAPTIIRHSSTSPFIDIGIDVEGRSLTAVARDVQTAVRSFGFPLEYHATLLNNYSTEQAANVRLMTASLAALLGIFLLMQASTRSWRLAFAVFLILPAGLVGGLVAAFLSGSSVSLISLFGLLTILGISARNGISLIQHYRHLELEEGRAFGRDLVLRGSLDRLGPTLITALATGLALLPFVFVGNVPGQEMLHPMSIIILGGLLTSTAVNLFAMPALYLGYGTRREAELDIMMPVADPSGAQD